MPELIVLSVGEQVAAHLRGELRRGRWSGTIPGRGELAVELGMNTAAVEVALRLLEKEGLLVSQGAGRRRLIKLPDGQTPSGLRVAILLFEAVESKTDYMIEIRHLLMEAGHAPFFPAKTMMGALGMDVKRVARYVESTEADAWVVDAGSREVLKWFAAQPTPAFALAGRMRGLSIAGTKPDKMPAYAAVTRKLIEFGHRRVSLLVRKERRLPEPGGCERAFLDELESHGIPIGAYNLPEWEESIEGFHNLLHSLCQVTRPTALIIDEAPLFIAAQQFLGNRGLRVPEDISLVFTDPDPHFAWCNPSVAHIRWESRATVHRLVRWADNVARGKKDIGQWFTKAEFVEGGTIGPARSQLYRPSG